MEQGGKSSTNRQKKEILNHGHSKMINYNMRDAIDTMEDMSRKFYRHMYMRIKAQNQQTKKEEESIELMNIIRYKNLCIKCGCVEYSEEKLHTCLECNGKMVSYNIQDAIEDMEDICKDFYCKI